MHLSTLYTSLAGCQLETLYPALAVAPPLEQRILAEPKLSIEGSQPVASVACQAAARCRDSDWRIRIQPPLRSMNRR